MESTESSNEQKLILISEEENSQINNIKNKRKESLEKEEEKKGNLKLNIIEGIKFEIQIDPELLINKSSDLDDYICPLCKGLFLNPIIDHCRHSFCKECFLKYYSIKHQCPISKEKINGDYISIDVLSKSIEKKEMKCKNYYKGCNWIGKISDLENHIKNNCVKSLVKCVFKGCNKEIMREELEFHKLNCEYREEKCHECNNLFPHKDINEHFKICPKIKMKCIQGCGLIVERGLMEKHIKENCNLTEINCSFHFFGCEDKFKKKELNSKMEKDCAKHLNLIAQELINIKNHIEGNNLKIKDFEVELEKKEKKIEELESNIKELLNTNNKNNISNKKKTITEIISLSSNDSSDKILSKKRERVNMENILINESIFDLSNINKSIKIKGNKALYKSQFSEKHVYLFANPEYDIDLRENKIREWKIKLLDESKWIAFGLCDKNLVLSNNQIFCSSIKEKNFNNGCYLISSNGYSWNCNNKFENNKAIYFPNYNEPFLLFCLNYNPNSFELFFYYENKLIKKLTNVKPFYSNQKLTPCIIFLDKDDTIELILNKN